MKRGVSAAMTAHTVFSRLSVSANPGVAPVAWMMAWKGARIAVSSDSVHVIARDERDVEAAEFSEDGQLVGRV
jgi:hypothetical protein